MPRFPNLISDSLLVNETISYLASSGGSATAVRVVDRVMKIRRPEPALAKMLVQDLIDRDARLVLNDDLVALAHSTELDRELASSDFVVVDLETTGAKAPPCRVTEVGAFKVRGGVVVDEFHSLVNPETPIPPFITNLTGISDAMVADAPRFSEIADSLLSFVGDSVLVAHNAHFDISFLNHEIGRVYDEYRLGNASLCTVQLSRRLLSDVPNHRLSTVAHYYGVELVNHHRARDDAYATAQIFLRLLQELDLLEIKSVNAAKRLSRRRIR